MTPHTPTHLMVGFAAALVRTLDAELPAGSVLIVEEPEVIAARRVAERVARHACVAGLLPAATQAEEHPERTVASLATIRRGIRAVIPSVEYGVVLAAALAEEWGLPGAGLAAARTFRDKASLRARVATTGIAQPAWALVAGPEEVERFRARHGVDCVLKPANRQASVGVQILGADHDARSAWPHTALAGEPRLRARDRGVARVLVEERLRGPEVSVETLVQDGATRLVNVTGKTVQRSRFPVELGHTVPADLPAGTIHELIASTRDLVTVTGFRCGILHAEWILVDGRPHLVECAARLPGDGIVTLIDLAYGGSLVRGLLDVLAGETPAPARTAIGGSAIRFLVAEPGTVTSIDGEDAARSLSGVHEVHIGVSPGGTVGTTTNSWDRAGHVIATGADGPAAARLAERAAALIRIRTEAPARAGGGG